MKVFGNSTVIYTKATCPYCVKAKQILRDRGIDFTEITIDGITHTKESMQADLGNKDLNTVPQIVLNGVFIPGGCSGLEKHFGL